MTSRKDFNLTSDADVNARREEFTTHFEDDFPTTLEWALMVGFIGLAVLCGFLSYDWVNHLICGC